MDEIREKIRSRACPSVQNRENSSLKEERK